MLPTWALGALLRGRRAAGLRSPSPNAPRDGFPHSLTKTIRRERGALPRGGHLNLPAWSRDGDGRPTAPAWPEGERPGASALRERGALSASVPDRSTGHRLWPGSQGPGPALFDLPQTALVLLLLSRRKAICRLVSDRGPVWAGHVPSGCAAALSVLGGEGQPEPLAKGFPTRRQLLADDVLRCGLLGPGDSSLEVEAILGPPDEREMAAGSLSFLYGLGPERDSIFQVDPELLLVELKRDRVTSLVDLTLSLDANRCLGMGPNRVCFEANLGGVLLNFDDVHFSD
jgi:hypothetical protein